jgi:hypothetical protein
MVRSQHNTIFGKEAAYLNSKHPFRWTDRHLDIFVRHVFNNPDICLQPALLNKLMAELNLNGYEDITTKAGHSVHEIIKWKVINKAKAVKKDLAKETDHMVIIKIRLGLMRPTSMNQASLTTTDNRAQLGQVQTMTSPQATPPIHTPSTSTTGTPSASDLQNSLPAVQKARIDATAELYRKYSSWNDRKPERQPDPRDPYSAFKNLDQTCQIIRANPAMAIAPDTGPRSSIREQDAQRGFASGQRHEQVKCMGLPDDQPAAKSLFEPTKPSLSHVPEAQDDDKEKRKVKKKEEEDDDDFPTFSITVDHDKLYNWTNDGLTRDRRRLMMVVLGKERGLSLAQELHMIQERIMAMGG